jgi:hypothetical protein
LLICAVTVGATKKAKRPNIARGMDFDVGRVKFMLQLTQ